MPGMGCHRPLTPLTVSDLREAVSGFTEDSGGAVNGA